MIDIVIVYNRTLKKMKADKMPVKILNLSTKVQTANRNTKVQSHFMRYLRK